MRLYSRQGRHLPAVDSVLLQLAFALHLRSRDAFVLADRRTDPAVRTEPLRYVPRWEVRLEVTDGERSLTDVRKTCDRDGADGPLCYKQMGWIETYLNKCVPTSPSTMKSR